MLFLANSMVLNFDFIQFEQLFKSQIYQNSKLSVSKIAINDIFGPFEFVPKCDFTQNGSGSRIIKY